MLDKLVWQERPEDRKAGDNRIRRCCSAAEKPPFAPFSQGQSRLALLSCQSEQPDEHQCKSTFPGWGAAGALRLQVSPTGCQFWQWAHSRFLWARYVSMRQPLTITVTSETQQEALKIKQQRSPSASNLGFIDRKMLNDRWSL